MKKQTKIKTVAIFENRQIRRHWDEEKELWYFSIIDVVDLLSGSTIPRRYWSDLKIKLKQEGSEVYDKIVQLKFIANDGKYYLSDAADTQTMFRIIQSIPSPKAEPFKLWLARVGYERVEEVEDPEKAILKPNSQKLFLKIGKLLMKAVLLPVMLVNKSKPRPEKKSLLIKICLLKIDQTRLSAMLSA